MQQSGEQKKETIKCLLKVLGMQLEQVKRQADDVYEQATKHD